MQERSEIDSFLDSVWAELGVDPQRIKQVGTGYDGQVYQISKHQCVKISKNTHYIAIPEALHNCEYLAIPQQTFISPSGMYVATLQPYLNLYSIQHIIRCGIILPMNQAIEIAAGFLMGLRRLHENGYVHRDMYPGNIMLSSDRGHIRAVIVDFDEMRQITPLTKACFRFNGYHDPDIVFYDRVYDDKAEMFAAGVVLWELFLGKCPFAGYELFGKVIEKSWEAYLQNKERCHQQVKNALLNMTAEIEKMRLVSGDSGDLLNLLLNPDRAKRITAAEALKHPLFQKEQKGDHDAE